MRAVEKRESGRTNKIEEKKEEEYQRKPGRNEKPGRTKLEYGERCRKYSRKI